MNESDLNKLIQSYTEEHNEMPAILAGRYEALSPVVGFAGIISTPEGCFYHTVFGNIRMELDSTKTSPELRGDS